MQRHPKSLSLIALVVALLATLTLVSCKTKTTSPTEDLGSLIESKESPYNNIYVYRKNTTLNMTFGLNQRIYTESLYNTADDSELPSPYTQKMTAALMYPEKINSILEIGLGGGRTAWYLHRLLPQAKITAVELDPGVVELAKKHFGVRDEANFQLITRDGRLFLADCKEKYDVILIDAYRGPFVPFHLLTKEFYEIVDQHLTPGGVMAQNVEPTTMLFDSSVKTVSEVFPNIEFYETDAASFLNGVEVPSNIVMVGYKGFALSQSLIESKANTVQSKYHPRYNLPEMLQHRFTLKRVPPNFYLNVVNKSGNDTGGIDENAKILTDDFAPVESLKAIERHNEKWKN